jgi:protease I
MKGKTSRRRIEMPQPKQSLRVAIIATDDFEEAEMTDPRMFLESQGAKTILIAPHGGKIRAMRHDEKSGEYSVDQTLDQANPDDFDALLIPGGPLNADRLRVEPKAQDFVRDFDREMKPIAVICHGPWLLVSAGLVKGRKLTSYHTIKDDLVNAGAEWADSEVVVDRNWVSSRQPSDIPKFNEKMKALFWGGAREQQPRAKAAFK